MNYFEINFKLPSLNEYQDKCRTNRYVGAKFKADIERNICCEILSALGKKTLKRVENYPVELTIEWHEETKKRDVDNIKSAVKFILDAMRKMGILLNDSQKYISQIHDKIICDKTQKVVVYID